MTFFWSNKHELPENNKKWRWRNTRLFLYLTKNQTANVSNLQDESQQGGQTLTWLDEMKRVSTSAPVSDGWMERCELTDAKKGNSALLTWHACQGFQIVRGQRWEQNRKKGTVLSQAGRARHVREPSVGDKIVPCDCALMRVQTEIKCRKKSNLQEGPEVPKMMLVRTANSDSELWACSERPWVPWSCTVSISLSTDNKIYFILNN